MTTLSLTGYVSIVDDSILTLNGDNATAFSRLDESYWQAGICRHVRADKSECMIKTTANTSYEKNGVECKRDELNGCHAMISVKIKKYSFKSTSNSKKIEGWLITAISIKQRSPILR